MPDPKQSVLVLDEDVLSLQLYSRELCGTYQVTTSENVQEARCHLQNEQFQALIIEPATNDGEGWLLLQETTRCRENPLIVIVCSVEDERKAGINQGASAFLVKPVLPATLHSLLDQILFHKPLQSV